MHVDGDHGAGEARLREQLRQALATGDQSRVSSTASAMLESGCVGPALDQLALHVAQRCAGGAPMRTDGALPVLLEALDRSGTVQRFVGSMLLDRTAVEDVAQESFISIMQSISGYRGDGAFTTWLHPIVRRRVADHLRRVRDAAPLVEEVLPSERMSSLIATRTTVREALAQLPEIYRAPVTLRDLEGMSYAEIAERLGRSVGTVKSQVSRGRALVAGMLEPADSQPGSNGALG